jgi:soluble lytic murein transglycosylase-like protein
MLTFAAAVVGVAATVGCGDASVGEMPSPILTAPPRATMTPAVFPAESGAVFALGTLEPERGVPLKEATPAPPTTLPPVPTAMVAATVRKNRTVETQGVEQWRPLVESIFPAFAVETVLRIMHCESGGDPNATGAAGERSLMQIHPLHYDSSYDPEANLRAAFRISGGGQSFSAWSCR